MRARDWSLPMVFKGGKKLFFVRLAIYVGGEVRIYSEKEWIRVLH